MSGVGKEKSKHEEGGVVFYTVRECEAWVRRHGALPMPGAEGVWAHRVEYPEEAHRYCWFSRTVASVLMYRQPALLWVEQTGIWQSCENWHLYYTLRRAQGDLRLLSEAPGHLFLDYESEELASVLQLVMLNGWDAALVTEAGYVSARFSHDEFAEFFAVDERNLGAIKGAFS